MKGNNVKEITDTFSLSLSLAHSKALPGECFFFCSQQLVSHPFLKESL